MTRAIRCCLLWFILVSLARPAWAQSWPALTGKELGYVIHLTDEPALSDTFAQRAEARFRQMLQTLLGHDARIVALNQPPLTRWLRDHALEELTPDLCRQFKLDETEKTIVLHVEWKRGVYYLAAVEYDRHFDQIDQTHRTKVLQRELVADSLGRLALRCWSPVGVLTGRNGATFFVRYPDTSRLVAVDEWSRLKSGAVLQLYREQRGSDGIQQKARSDQFLVVQQVTPQGFECALALPETQTADPWFRQLQDPHARYLVRRLTATGGSIHAKVVFKDSLVPREGCEVSTTDSLHLTPKSLGHTGVGGDLPVEASSSGLLYVTIRYDDVVQTKVCFVGVSPDPLLFQITARGSASDLESEIARFEDRLRDNVAVLNDVVRQMNEAKKLNDVPKMQELLTQAEQTSNLADLQKAVTELSRKVPAAETSSVDRVKRLLADIQQVGKETNLNGFRTSVRSGRSNVLKQQIAAAYNECRWQDATKSLTEYVQLVPMDDTAKARLDELNAGLPEKNAAHRAARSTIEQRVGIARIDDLIMHWDELHAALKTAIQHKDRLWLMTAEKDFNTWTMLVNEDVDRIKATVAAGTQNLDQSQTDELARRAMQLEKLGEELSVVLENADKVLEADADK